MTTIKLLTIAGSDSGGGAGIQADLKTFSALGGYGMTVITALTAQNTMGVQGVYPVPPEFVEQQLDSVLGDIGVDAIKIGMLANAKIIKAVADRLREHQVNQIVLDPVMVATSGDRLLQASAVDALRKELLPLATIITPNIPEAEDLLETKLDSDDELEQAASALLAQGPRAVLIKGGHGKSANCDDILAYQSETGPAFEWIKTTRVKTQNTHGTGCTLSSAIAAYMGHGLPLPEAVRAAKDYITKAIQSAAQRKLGNGHGPVDHFHTWHPISDTINVTPKGE